MDKFLETKLCNFLGFEIPKEMIDHILNLRTEPEIREYFNGLLDKSDHKQRQFVNEFINKRNLKTPPNKTKTRKKNNKSNIASKNSGLHEIKSDFEELEKKYQIALKKESKDKCENDKDNNLVTNINSNLHKYENPYEKYKKFVPFDFSKEAYPLLPSRKLCGCYAKRHKLVNNCTECGRIQCEQEGSGPCMFCGSLVVSIEEKAIIDSDTSQGDALMKKLMNQPKPEGWEAALENQKKLRDADIARQEKQRIVDDQADYFILTRSVWNDKTDMNDISRQIKENAERATLQKLAINTTTNVSLIKESDKKQIEKCLNNKKQNKSKKSDTVNVLGKKPTGISFDDEWRLNTARDLDMECQVAKIEKEVEDYLENLPVMRMPELREKLFYQDPRTADYYSINYNNEYDWENEFWELNDYFDRLGFCISIRQPYASLIMAGIKNHEGRDWNVDLRGVIWIASAAKKPSQEEIEKVEKFYKYRNENKDIKFPKNYPTGRLLGRAQIVTCLKREEYVKKFPNGEVDDEYAIILDDIIPLPILIPLKGYAGIYILPKKLHTAAGLMIRKLLQDNSLISN